MHRDVDEACEHILAVWDRMKLLGVEVKLGSGAVPTGEGYYALAWECDRCGVRKEMFSP